MNNQIYKNTFSYERKPKVPSKKSQRKEKDVMYYWMKKTFKDVMYYWMKK
tara:strand:- start:2367 stop:2516 length:150 start_codon:yes stop_codon:yes gene_type:complete